jgi:hypothetical protein
MSLQLNLEKSAKSLVLSLEKAGILTVPRVELGLGMDVTGSFDDEHRQLITDSLLTRIAPWGLTFDPDEKLDVFTFADGPDSIQDIGPVDTSNYFGFLPRKIFGVEVNQYPNGIPERVQPRLKGYGGSTDYSYIVERLLSHFGWTGQQVVKRAGFFGRMMGQKDTVSGGEKKRSLAIIVTDGDNFDKPRTKEVLRASEARGDQVYFLFLGISNQGSSFPFLEELDKEFGNTAFVKIPDLHEFVALDDDALNAKLLKPELLKWLADSGK